MSVTYVALVLIDDAPHDSDSEKRPILYEFPGPDNARRFYDQVVGWIKTRDPEIIVQVFEPEPTRWFENNDEGFYDFLGEVDR